MASMKPSMTIKHKDQPNRQLQNLEFMAENSENINKVIGFLEHNFHTYAHLNFLRLLNKVACWHTKILNIQPPLVH